jgi:hypothetical protein
MTCIPVKVGKDFGIICVVKADFECPKCGYAYHEEDYYNRLYKSKNGLIYKKCKGCHTQMGITTDFKGDVRVWLKETETINLINKKSQQ